MSSAGIDIFCKKHKEIIKGRVFDLVTGSSVIDGTGEAVYRRVKKLCSDNMRALWALQHGFFLDKQDNMILSDSFHWKELDASVYSLYGENLTPEAMWLDGLDALLVDTFDVGTRVYTFVNHMIMIMKVLSGKDIDIIVLDRPNPLNGLDFEGPVIDEDYFSIVGLLPVPMRHGLTAGEYLRFGADYYNLDINVEVIKVPDWNRGDYAGNKWTYPSPNMPSFATAMVYPGAVMLEGTNLSEARGTTRPFEFCGAPWIDNFELADFLRAEDFYNSCFTPIFFKPEFSKFKGEVCKGVYVAPEDSSAKFNSFGIFYEIIRFAVERYSDKFRWSEPPYEFEYKRPPIDMICGGPLIRESIEKNIPWKDLAEKIQPQLEKYRNTIEKYLLY